MANYQVNLGVTANVSQAQQSIQNLQTTLNNIANTKITVQGGSIDTAAKSAQLLSEHLTKATNVSTGKIDFSALSASLKNANTDLQTLSHNLLAMGPKGQQAFSQIANAVAHAELSTKKANGALQSFGVTLMNTIKWQAASTMIHGVMSTFSAAVSHVKALDTALNNIQIVTSKSAEEMASFARRAQDLSKALSSTTEEYAKASLIFFQQGLKENEVLARTEATIKMAKVTGDAVQTVSDQLTAIWNNFDNGTQSLEYYVDVITALGAATASSTSEISDGLQKFAAIAETVGLSYEYAATALATVTAETRQSADVVGTAFKTLFARIQGLKLGETLDDGTTLNQYSQALAKVGIDIKTSAGDLKDMNTILEEMGNRWSRLNKDQQVALAQSVGGIRQYNQLIALMDNWDTFKVNLEIAEDSKGTLDEQFEIYQNSIDASAAKLKNATQSLYESLLDPDTIKSFNEGLTDTINILKRLIENAGGLNGLLKFGGLLLLQTALPKLQMFLTNAAARMKDFIGYTKAAKMYELGTMAKTSHSIAGTAAAHENTTIGPSNGRVGKLMQKSAKAHYALENDKGKGFMHGVHEVQAAVADAKLETKMAQPKFMPNTQGISGVDMDSSALSMRNQMMQEEAGYTATILDTKKQILALENGLTDKQREGYKAYSDQVAKEQEALRLAREKQSIAKDTADQSSRGGTMKVGASQAGRDRKQEQNEEIRASKKADLDKEHEDRLSKMDKHSKTYGSDKDALDKEIAARKAEVDQTSYVSNKQVDLKGDETRSMVAGFKDSDMSTTGQAMTQSMTENLTQSTDGSGPAASVENLEKLGQLQAQYNADAEKAQGIYTELSGNIGEAGKRTEQQQKTLKKTGDTMKTLGKDAKTGLVKNLEDSAKAMEDTGENADGLRKVMKSLEDGSDIDLGELNPKELEAVKKSVGNLDEGLTEASTSAGELANAMSQDMASATGQDAKIFTGIADDAQAAKASALDADGAAKQLQDRLNTQPPVMPDPFGSVIQGATQATAAFTSFAMGTQMLTTGITTAFDENATAVEKLMGWMMMLQGVMSTINAIQSVANVIDTIAVAVKLAKGAALKKESKEATKNSVTTTVNTAATTANAVAKLFAAMASKGWAGIIAGVLGAALIVGTVAIVANTLATQKDTAEKEKATAASKEEAQARKDNAAKVAEETTKINESADAYKKLYDAYKETGEVKSDFEDSTLKLAQSLGIENAALLILTGQYEALNAEIRKRIQLQNEENKKASKESVGATGAALITATGTSNDNFKIVDASGSTKGQFILNAGDDGDFVGKFLASDDGAKYREAGFSYDDDTNQLIASFSDEGEVTKLAALAEEMISSSAFRNMSKKHGGKGANSTIFANFSDFKENAGETWDSIPEVLQAEEDAIINASFANHDFYAADSNEDFGKTYEAYIEEILREAGNISATSEEGKRLIKAARDKITSESDLDEKWSVYSASETLPENVKQYLANQHGGDATKITDEEWRLATSVFIDPDATEDEITQYLDNAQAILDANTLEAQVKTIPAAIDSVKNNKTKEDWDNWFEQQKKDNPTLYTNMGWDKQENRNTFMGLTVEEQQNQMRAHQPSYSEVADSKTQSAAGHRSNAEQNQNTANRLRPDVEKQSWLEKASVQLTNLSKKTSNENLYITYQGSDGGKYGLLTYDRTALTDTEWHQLRGEYEAFLIEAQGYGFIPTWSPPTTQDPMEAINQMYPYVQEVMNAINQHYGADENGNYMFTTSTSSHTYIGPNGMVNPNKATTVNGTTLTGVETGQFSFVSNVGYYKGPAAGTYQTTDERTTYNTAKGSVTTENTSANSDEQSAATYNSLAFKNAIENEGFDETDEIIEYSRALQQVKSDTVETKEEAEQLALTNSKLKRGLALIADNFDDISYGLKNKDKDIEAYGKSLNLVKKGLADVFNIDSDKIDTAFSEDFLASEHNLLLMQQAAQGSAEALKELRRLAALDYIINLNLEGDVSAQVTNLVNDFMTSDEYANLEVGVDLNTTSFYKSLEEMVNAGLISVDTMNDILSRVGGAPPVNYIEVPANEASQYFTDTNQKVFVPDGNGGYKEEYVTAENVSSVYGTSTIRIPYIGTNEKHQNLSGNAKIVASSSFTGHTMQATKPSGGGGSKKKADKVKKSDVVERYKEITDSIEDVQNAADKATQATEGLYGIARIKNMQKVNSLLKQELGLLGKKRKEAVEYLALDRQALEAQAKESGVNLTFDADGDISNYTAEMTKLYNELDAAIEKANKDGNADEKEQEEIDKIQKRIDDLKTAIEDYEATKEILLELDQEEIDKFNEQLENNLEQINAKVELEIGFNEKDLEFIEYYLSKMESDVFQQAEAAALVVGKAYDGNSQGKLDIAKENLKTYTDQYYELEKAFQAGKISSAQYVESMQELSSTMLSELSTIQELDTAMKEYYGNTISMAQDEMAKYTDRMAHATTVLDHYNSILTSLGKQNDYKLMGTVLDAQAKVAKSTYDASAAAFKMFREQADARKAEYEVAKNSNTTTAEELSILEEQWLAAEAAAEEAQDQMLSDAATYAEQMKALLENSLGAYAQELEDALTLKFGSFTNLSTEMERAKSLQEEFLTTTNKIYETNKMMRTAQQEIDKTTNQMAKQKLKQFINETAAMQKQSKLSQYELDVQQAKYDLLLAEIALKEAQNAKSTVRLQRDSEGNFGYVYTADQNAIADAQQKFEDAQNALYNKGLEGANDYAQKYADTMSEMYDTLGEIQQQYLDGEFASEIEYENAMKKAREYYYKKLEDYSNLYNVSLSVDSRVFADSWSKEFGEMTKSTEEWMKSVDGYISNVTSAFSAYNDIIGGLEQSALGDVTTEVGKIVTETEKIRDILTSEGGVIDALDSELDAVVEVTQAYLAQRDALEEILQKSKAIAELALNNAKNTAYDEVDVAPGSQVTVKSGITSWVTGDGKEDDNMGSVQGGHGYTVIRWDTGKQNVLISDGAGNYGWVSMNDLVGFDSGGYTGSWGSYGKMAMLHEKELVLNAQDTENLLTSIEFLHHILQMIDLQSMSSQLGGILTSPYMSHSDTSEIEQNVHIEASFPNVTSHSEIEEAFNNLINTSSQYAFKR